MQMRIIHSGTASRKKDVGEPTTSFGSPNTIQIQNKFDCMNKMILMRGTATRKPLEKCQKTASVNPIHKYIFSSKRNSKLQTPFYKPRRQRGVQTEEKFMSKSCETLFDCIKPFEETMKSTQIHVMESSKTVKGPLYSSVIFEQTATRKVEFFTFSEPIPDSVNANKSLFDILENEEKLDSQTTENQETIPKETITTISSEDFIKNAFTFSQLQSY